MKKAKKLLSIALTLAMGATTAFAVTACDENNTATQTDNLIANLQATLENNKSELNDKINALKEEYKSKDSELLAQITANQQSIAAMQLSYATKLAVLELTAQTNAKSIDDLKKDYLAKIEELSKSDGETASALAQLKSEYEGKVAELIQADETNKQALESLTAEHTAKMEELASAGMETAYKLAQLKSEYEGKIAELIQADQTNKQALEGLTAEYTAKVEELARADSETAEALADLRDTYENRIEELVGADEENARLIEGLKKDYLAKIEELSKADGETASALAGLKATYESKVAELSKADADNKKAVEDLEKAYLAKVQDLIASDNATVESLDRLRAEYETSLKALKDADLANAKAIADLRDEYTAKAEELVANDTATAEAIAELKGAYETSLQELLQADEENAKAINELKTAYLATVETLVASDTANAGALAELKTAYEKKVAELNTADEENAKAINELKTAYLATVETLVASDTANAEALAELKTAYEKKVAELNTADKENAKAINELKTAYLATVETLVASDTANAEALAELKSAYETSLQELLQADEENKNSLELLRNEYTATMGYFSGQIMQAQEAIEKNKTDLETSIANLTANYEQKMLEIDALLETLQNTDTTQEEKIAELVGKITALEQATRITEIRFTGNGDLIITFGDGSTQTVNAPETHTHIFGNWTVFTTGECSCEDKLFYRVCSDCNGIEWKQGSYADHDWDIVTTAPTCQAQGFDTKTCEICGKVEIVNDTPAIPHPWATEYSYDTSYHWYNCQTCDEINAKQEHTDDGNGNCSVCEYPIGPTAGVLYDILDGRARVVGYTGTGTRVRIAETYNGFPVTEICSRAFYENKNLAGIVIPEGVTSIGYEAFYKCDNLTSVILPESLSVIGGEAFFGCYDLTSVEIPNGVTSIGYEAFTSCYNLKSIFLPESVTNINGNVFGVCYKLTAIEVAENNPVYQSIDGNLYSKDGKILISYAIGKTADYFAIPEGVESIGKYAFEGCENLTGVVIGNSVSVIGDYAFYGCHGLKNIIIGESVVSIGDYAFYNCNNLKSVVVGNNVKNVGSWAFSDCENLQFNEYENCKYLGNESNPYFVLIKTAFNSFSSYAIHENTRVIADYAFNGCSSLTSIIIPEGVTSIGKFAFQSCERVTSIVIPDSVRFIGEYAFYSCMPTIVTCPTIAISAIYKGNLQTIVITSGDSIGDSAFYDCNSLTSIAIPGSVTSIGNWAFVSCDNLTSITIPDSVSVIGDYIFYDCINLTGIVIPEGVSVIGYEAFEGCYNLTSVELPDSITSIGDYAFEGCSNLTNIEIPEGVSVIGKRAFYDCGLTSVVIPEGVSVIGEEAFLGCPLTIVACPTTAISKINKSNLQTIVFTSGEEIDREAFRYCTNLTSVVIGDSVRVIGYQAFYECHNLTSVVIGKSVETIGDYAFYNCNSLTSVAIPDGVSVIGDYAFYNCNSLTSVSITDITAWCNISFKNSYSNPLYYAQYLYLNNELITDLIIPEAVSVIKANAFNNCRNLTSVVIPEGVTSIENGVFSYCDGLTRVVIPESVTSIGGYAFSHCTSLQEITLPENLTSIDNGVCYDCDSLTSVVIPEGVESIGDYAFNSCERLTNIVIPDSVTNIGENAFNDCPLTSVVCPTIAISYLPKTTLQTVEITSGEEIDSGAFRYCDNLTSVIIGDSVSVIGYEAFYHCEKLVSIAIGKGVASIEKYAFEYCNSLTSVYITDIGAWCTISFSNLSSNPLSIAQYLYLNNELVTDLIIPDGVSVIGYEAFYGYKALTSVEIPDSVTSIGKFAFSNCSGLTSIVIGDGLTSVGDWVFSYCDSLASITIGENVTSIGEYAFAFCYGLTSVEIPYGVESIGGEAFSYCENLTNIVIPDSVTNIGENAFYDCPLVSVVCPTIAISYLPKTTLQTVEITSGERIEDGAFYNSDSLTSVIIGDTVSVIGEDAFAECWKLTSVEIPDGVESIGGEAFFNCCNLKSIAIGGSVSTIGERVFYGCDRLESVYITDITAWCNILFEGQLANPLHYAKNMYLNDELVTELIIPDSVTVIGEYAFEYCDNLTSVVISEGVESIGAWAFSYCENLTNIVIPDSVTNIGENAFCDCPFVSVVCPTIAISYLYLSKYTLETIVFTSGEEIDGEAFYCCSSLTSVVIGDSVRVIGNNAFEYCTNLTSVVIGKSVETIGEYAFAFCYGLTSVEIPYGVESIGDYAFNSCERLTNIVIPDSVTSIGYDAFEGCYNLTGVYITDITAWCKISFESPLANPLYYAKNLYLNNELVTELIIPDGVPSIGVYAFYNCSSLTSVIIDSGSISGEAFWGCTNLTQLVLGKNVTRIGARAFNDTNLTRVYYEGTPSEWDEILITITVNSTNLLPNLPRYYYSEEEPASNEDGTGYVENYLYLDENGNAVYVGNYWHYDTDGVTPVVWVYVHKHTEIIIDAVAPTCTKTGLTEGSYCATCGKVVVAQEVIPENGHNFVDYQCTVCNEWDYTPVEYFEFSQWNGQYRIEPKSNVEYPETVVLPNTYNGFTVEIVLSFAKTGSNFTTSNIATFVITDGYTAVAGSAFPAFVTTVILPSTVTDIAYGSVDTTAFFNANHLENVIVAKNNAVFQSIDGVLYSKDGSKLIIYPSKKADLAFSVPQSVAVIGQNAFRNTVLEEVVLGNGVTEIEPRAFIYSGIKKIVLSESLTYIGEYTFDSCENLTEIIIPDGVTKIEGWSAFGYCSALQKVVIGIGVTSIANGAFRSCGSLASVYYKGGASDWAGISIGSENDCLTNAVRYYYSEEEPEVNADCTGYDGNYWHYGENGESVIWVFVPKAITYSFETNGADYPIDAIEDTQEIVLPIPQKAGRDFAGWYDNEEFYGEPVRSPYYSKTDITLYALWLEEGVYQDGQGVEYTRSENGGCLTVTNYRGAGNTVIIPSSYNGLPVTRIGDWAFSGKEFITSVSLPNTIVYIGTMAFESCKSLSAIAIPESVTELGDYAFNFCNALTSVSIPASVAVLGELPFANCAGLNTITVALENQNYCSIDGVLYSKDGKTLVEYPTGRRESGFVLADTVTEILFGAFSKAEYLQAITVSNAHPLFSSIDGVLYSKDGAILLQYPSGKKDGCFAVPDGVTEIAGCAFNGNSYLTEIRFNGVTKVCDMAFANCFNLQSVIIPETISQMGMMVFANCQVLAEVYCEATELPEGWSSLWRETGVLEIVVHWGYTQE